jgi:hypothetical protein
MTADSQSHAPYRHYPKIEVLAARGRCHQAPALVGALTQGLGFGWPGRGDPASPAGAPAKEERARERASAEV